MAKINKVINVKIEGVGKIKQLEDSLKKLRKQQRDIKKDMKDGTNAGKNAEKQYRKNENAIKSQSKALRETKKAMLDANNATKKGTSLQNSMAMGVIKGAAAFSILVTAFRRVSQALTTMIGTFTEFEFTMAKVQAVSGANAEEFKRLSDSAQELGRSTFYTASEVANLQLNLSKLGFTVEEIEAATEATINLAVATGSDLARSATVAGNAVRGFQLDATETGRVVDVMAVAFTSSALDIEKWQTSMTKVAPIAAMAGFTIEETTAIMAKLADTGIEASIAGTSLRNIFLKMQDPTSDLTKRVGHTITSLDQMVEVFQDLQDEGADLADILSFMDVRQVAAFGTMLDGIGDIQALRDELMLAEGAGQAMAHTVGDTLQGSIFKVKSALQGVSIALVQQFGDSLKKTLVRLASWLNSLVENEEKLKEFWETVKFTTKMIVAFVLGLKPARAALKYLAADTALASGAMSGLTIATNIAKLAVRGLKIAIASTGIGLLIIGLGELVTWLIFSQSETERLADITDEYGRKIADIVDIERSKKEIDEEIINQTKKKISQVDLLVRAYKRAEGNEKDRLRILGKLADVSEKHFGHLRGQTDAFNDAEIAAESYKEELKKLAKVEATKGALVEVEGEILKLEMQVTRAIEEAYFYTKTVKQYTPTGNYDNFKAREKAFRTMFGTDDWRGQKSWDMIQAGLVDELTEAREWRVTLEELIDEMDIGDLLDFDTDDGGGSVAAEYTMQEKIDKEKANVAFVQLEEQHQVNMLNAKLRGIKAFRNQANVSTEEDKRALIAQNETERALKKANYKLELKSLKLELDAAKLNAEETITVTETLNAELIRLDNEFSNEKKALALKYGQDIRAIDNEIKEEEIKKNKSDFKVGLKNLTDTYEQQKLNLDLMLANEQITASQHQEMMLALESKFLQDKLALHLQYGQDQFDLNNLIKQNTIDTITQQREALNEYISSLGQLGNMMQELAGEEEEMNALRKAGIVLTEAAATAEQILTMMTTLRTIATYSQVTADAAQVAGTGAVIAADTAKVGSNIAVAGSGFIAAIANGIKSLPFPFNLIAIGLIIAAIFAAKRKISNAFKAPSGGSSYSGSSGGSSGSQTSSSSGGSSGMMALMTFGGRHQTVGEISGYADGGIVYGKSHGQGGEKFAVGGRVVELEGGEAVINKRSTSMFRSQLSAINYAGGGVQFADGGITNTPSFAQTQFDVAGQQGLKGAIRERNKVVVVEADITSSQNTVNAIESQAAF